MIAGTPNQKENTMSPAKPKAAGASLTMLDDGTGTLTLNILDEQKEVIPGAAYPAAWAPPIPSDSNTPALFSFTLNANGTSFAVAPVASLPVPLPTTATTFSVAIASGPAGAPLTVAAPETVTLTPDASNPTGVSADVTVP